jgi:hypothetical protein
MVSTDELVTDAPHRHVPVVFSEPYVESGIVWVVGICECGIALAARPASAVRETHTFA